MHKLKEWITPTGAVRGMKTVKTKRMTIKKESIYR